MLDIPSAVLFACTMNSVRSPMAEGILKYLHGARIYVDSVGVHELDVDGFAVAVMDEIGIDVSRHRAKTFEELEDSYFDLVISLSPEAQHKAVEMTRVMACEVEFLEHVRPVFDRVRKPRGRARRLPAGARPVVDADQGAVPTGARRRLRETMLMPRRWRGKGLTFAVGRAFLRGGT